MSDPPRQRQVVRQQRGGVTSFDIGPPGFAGGLGRMLAMFGFIGTMVLPLSITGLIAGISFTDWGSLRWLVGLAGGAVTAAYAALMLRWLAWALFRRERLQVGPAGVRLRAGYPWWSRCRGPMAAPAPAVVDRSRLTQLPGWRLRLSDDGGEVELGGGLDRPALDALAAQVGAALSDRSEADDPGEWRYPLGWGLARAGRELLASLWAPLRRPLPFMLCDLATVGATGAGGWLAGAGDLDGKTAYLLFAGLFFAGLAARRLDPSYLAGLRGYDRRWLWFPMLYVGCALAIGLGCSLVLIDRVHVAVALGGPPLLAIALAVYLLRAARASAGDAAPPRRWPLELGATLALVPLALLHQQYCFEFFASTSRDLSVMALPMVAPLVAAVYLPVRLHCFIDDPSNRSNRLWFALTVFALTIYGVFGVRLG